MDIIITLVNGQVGEIGSFTELVGNNGAFAEYLKNYTIKELTSSNKEDEAEGILCDKSSFVFHGSDIIHQKPLKTKQ